MPVYWMLLLLLMPAAAWAADGSAIGTVVCSGGLCIEERFLCDGDHQATDCAELDLSVETAGGLPLWWVAELRAETGCAGAPTVTVRGLSTPLGMPVNYAALTTAGTSAVKVDPLRHRHVDATVAGAAGCTDLEVVIRLFRPR